MTTTNQTKQAIFGTLSLDQALIILSADEVATIKKSCHVKDKAAHKAAYTPLLIESAQKSLAFELYKQRRAIAVEISEALGNGCLKIAKLMNESKTADDFLVVANMLPHVNADEKRIKLFYNAVKANEQNNSYAWIPEGKTVGREGTGEKSVFRLKDKARPAVKAPAVIAPIAPKLEEGKTALGLGNVIDNVVVKLNETIALKNQRIAELETSLLQLQSEHYKAREYNITLTALLAKANAKIEELTAKLATQAESPVMLRRVK